jgi:hypothetical protein
MWLSFFIVHSSMRPVCSISRFIAKKKDKKAAGEIPKEESKQPYHYYFFFWKKKSWGQAQA